MSNASLKEEYAERAADVLVESLRHTLEDASLRERKINIDIDRVEERPYKEERGAGRALEFDVAHDLHVGGHLSVRNFGGNVYYVRAQIAEGEGLRWQMCIPELEAEHDVIKKHTDDFSRRLLLELERLYGEHSMQTRETSQGR